MIEKTFKYSEIFRSFQGEGHYTGRSTAWIRLFLCNMACDGFGQEDPTNPSTYILPYKDFDVSAITSVEDLPVFEVGCDSSYTWAKKYKHLMKDENEVEICDQIQDSLKHESNIRGLFKHPLTNQDTHMAFTGGEPMLNQPAINAILREFSYRDNIPNFVTVETNGTKLIKDDELEAVIQSYSETYRGMEDTKAEWFWSVSPKLWSTAGEKPKKAICPEVVAQYAGLSDHGQLKYVVNGTPESWAEVEEHTKAFREAGVNWDVYIMAVGATKEEQEGSQIADIAMEAMKRGYHFSGRLHAHIFGNKVGT